MRASRNGETGNHSYSEKKPIGAGMKALIVVAVCAVLYFVCAGALGSWMSENIVAPVLSVFEPLTTTDTGIQSNTSVNEDVEMTSDITLPELTAYALQSGIYRQDNYAQEDAAAVMARGGAGYIYDSDYMRVIVSAYSSQSDASAVHDQLMNDDNYETWEYVISAPETTLSVTATESEIAVIKDFFSFISETSKKLESYSAEYSENNISAEEISAETSDIAAEFATHEKLLSNLGQDDGGILPYILELASELKECVVFDGTGKSDVEILSKLKYNYIWYTDVYSRFLEEIRGNAV